MPLCLFCELRPGHTVEHLFSEAWLQKVMPSVDPYKVELVRVNQGERFEKIFHRSRPEIEVAGFCDHCNNGWMNDLDLAVQPLLTTMLRGQRRRLDEMTAPLSTWVCKTAMVADCMLETPTLSQEHRDYLFNYREPPPGWRIWLARVEAAPQHRILVAPITLIRPSGLGYVFTAILDQLAIQALVLPIDETSHTHPMEPEIVQPLWPMPTTRIAWPEVRALRGHELAAFSDWVAGAPLSVENPPCPMPVTYPDWEAQ